MLWRDPVVPSHHVTEAPTILVTFDKLPCSNACWHIPSLVVTAY